jgi:hypothetical protein
VPGVFRDVPTNCRGFAASVCRTDIVAENPARDEFLRRQTTATLTIVFSGSY